MSQPQPHYSSELFTRLRAATLDDWKPYIDHEFVRGLGDGTLPKAAFLHYLRQDYVYLHHYTRAFALGVVKANTLQETRLCAQIMHGLAVTELPLHVGICAREGISEDALYATKEEPENLAYTRYVLDCGQAGDFLDLLTALVPCAHGYGEIGLNLAVTALPGTPYQEWIDTYAGPDYQDMCHTVGKLFDQAAKDRIGDDFEKKPALAKALPDFRDGKQARSRFLVYGLEGRIVNEALPNRSRKRRAADGLLSAAIALAIWQAVVSIGQMPRFILPGPLDVVQSLIGNAGLIAENAAATIGEVLGGLVLGCAVGIATAICLMMSPLAQRLVMPAMVFSQAIPIFALAPILTLWLGYGPASKIAVTVLMIFFPVVSTFFDGMRRTDSSLIDAAEILGAGRMAILFRIRIPSAFPSLASGLSLAAVYAPIGAVVGEWVGASKGLGYLMLLANGRAKVDLMFACLFVLAAFTMLLHGTVSHFARKLAAWPKKAA